MTAVGGGFVTEWDNFAREEYVMGVRQNFGLGSEAVPPDRCMAPGMVSSWTVLDCCRGCSIGCWRLVSRWGRCWRHRGQVGCHCCGEAAVFLGLPALLAAAAALQGRLGAQVRFDWRTGRFALQGGHSFVLHRNIGGASTFGGTSGTRRTGFNPNQRMQRLHRFGKGQPCTQPRQTLIQMQGVLTGQQPQFLVQRGKKLPRRQESVHIAA